MKCLWFQESPTNSPSSFDSFDSLTPSLLQSTVLLIHNVTSMSMFPWTIGLYSRSNIYAHCEEYLYLCLSFIIAISVFIFLNVTLFFKIHLILLVQYLIWGHIDRVYLIHLGLCLLETTVAGEIGRSGRCAPLTLWGRVCSSIRGRPDGRGERGWDGICFSLSLHHWLCKGLIQRLVKCSIILNKY